MQQNAGAIRAFSFCGACGAFYLLSLQGGQRLVRASLRRAAGALSSHSFSKNLKRYARLAGIEKINVHQLRHTVAQLVGDNTGDLGAVQNVLGHKNLATTRVYLRTISVKRDTHSAGIAARLGL